MKQAVAKAQQTLQLEMESIKNKDLINEDVESLNKNSNKAKMPNKCKTRKSNLRTHLKTRSGEKSNKCIQCEYASSYASNLKSHLKKHSGEKSNKCNQCDYASSTASNLSRHLKKHSVEK